ncbi:GNAT family N-acetyltransferase [Litoribrevibacter albus]|uniref:Acetyltransferase n=1 Tax=Litoribrevibacter albus TaxID=1473156 RepID=A0AA37S9M6_9GAMM|nr:GNAT family N-acetyltransferase [Litoribrevibacter albus]GLQ31770.1 putative acetyltransferase [Litoribrevibacter albus]
MSQPINSSLSLALCPVLSNRLVKVRPLVSSDFEGLYAVASDPLLWAGHPAKNRYQRDIFEAWFDDALASDTALVILDQRLDRIIGSTRFYTLPSECSEVAIGYSFIARSHWGGEYNRAVKALMLNYAFQSVDRVWFHIDPDNVRSRTATQKFGAEYSRTDELDGVLYDWFELSKERWLSLES